MDCTRDKAETILSLARSSGNVLLRPSSTFIIDGKYVISFRTDILGWVQKLDAYWLKSHMHIMLSAFE